jgi:DNA repair protein RadC
MTAKKATSHVEDNTPHYHGHRDRLRAKLLERGPESLADYELLELMLFLVIPRRDVKPLAKELIAHFGSFHAVFHASYDALRAYGLSNGIIAGFKTIHAASLKILTQDMMSRPVLNSWDKLLDYLRAGMGHESQEQFRLLFLNKKNELIADEVQQRGTVDHTPAYPREIIKRALELHATAIILVHNHPSGDPKPSKADMELTRTICDATKAVGIVVHDHIIVARNTTFSFKSQGLL